MKLFTRRLIYLAAVT